MTDLTTISGPMFADKTTTLIALIRGNEPHFCETIVVKPLIDSRYQDNLPAIISHNGDRYPAIECDSDNLRSIEHGYGAVIYIDEGHFFPNIVEDVKHFLKAGAKVVVAGLDLDFRHEGFQNMQELMAMAKINIQCKAICQCGAFAKYTKMREDLQTENNIDVGGAEKYAPCCGAKLCEDTWA
jgi:thymidine kinase